MIHAELIFRPCKAHVSVLVDKDAAAAAERFAYPGIMQVRRCKILRQAALKSMLRLSVFSPDHEYLAAICLCPKICTISSKLKILPCESKHTFSMRPSRLEARSCKCP